MLNHNSRKIIAIFDSFAWADAAARFLRVWEEASHDTEFRSLTLVYETEDEQIKVRNHGPRKTLRGAETGLLLGMLAGRMVGAQLLRGMLAGAVVGALAGSLSREEPDLAPEEQANLLKDLKKGKAGLV